MKTKEELAEEYMRELVADPGNNSAHPRWMAKEGFFRGYAEGRNSAEESLEIAVQALEKEIFRQEKEEGGAWNSLVNAIAEIKKRGDWPIEENAP